jgi:hypothetical protein
MFCISGILGTNTDSPFAYSVKIVASICSAVHNFWGESPHEKNNFGIITVVLSSFVHLETTIYRN